MKTIVVLEPSEIERISSGEPLALRLADGSSITIQAERESDGDRDKPRRGPQKNGRRRTIAGQGPYSCDSCGRRFAAPQGLAGHSSRGACASGDKGGKAQRNVMLRCAEPGCDYHTLHPGWLNRHREKEHG